MKSPSNSDVCHLFNNYVAQSLNIYNYNNQINFHMQDCHHIPQWNYAKHATYEVPYKDLRKPEFLKFLSSYFDINSPIDLGRDQ